MAGLEVGDDLRVGLLVLGYRPAGEVNTRRLGSAVAYRHPEKSSLLFLGACGRLRVGRSFASSDTVHDGFRTHALKRARHALAGIDLKAL